MAEDEAAEWSDNQDLEWVVTKTPYKCKNAAYSSDIGYATFYVVFILSGIRVLCHGNFVQNRKANKKNL